MEHHRQKTFKDEFRELLNKYGSIGFSVVNMKRLCYSKFYFTTEGTEDTEKIRETHRRERGGKTNISHKATEDTEKKHCFPQRRMRKAMGSSLAADGYKFVAFPGAGDGNRGTRGQGKGKKKQELRIGDCGSRILNPKSKIQNPK